MPMPGFKVPKHRLSLWLEANASGGLTVNPMLSYHSENSRCPENEIELYLCSVNEEKQSLDDTTSIHNIVS